jgi:type I restriction-modification system DNA methylase subunit
MTFRASVEKYLKAVAAQQRSGDAREESFYDALKVLFVDLGPQVSNAHTTLTVLPSQTEAGNPDMRVWSGDQHVTGYIECKHPDVANLDRVEVSEQLKRYRGAFPNVILTNFLEFRLYRYGQPLGEPVVIANHQALNLGKQPPLQHEEQFLELVQRFFDFQLPRAYTAQTLAVALADRTRFLQRQVLDQLIDDQQQGRSSELVNLMAEFKQVLMSDLTTDTFADLYAQTITYGLFAARMRMTGAFTRQTALNGIPATIGILRRLFKYISIGETPERLGVIIDDIADVLAVADTNAMFQEYDKNSRDPIADFYETFLGEYDPAKRKQHGVYYTPQPVVSYIVRSIDTILRDTFGKPDGLADPSVTVLDPAAGTMTFTATAVRLAAETFKAKYGDGSTDSWVQGHVLRDFYAFELMMAPYAIGHLRMGTLLTELGYTMKSEDRFKLYLTNTLDVSTAEQNPIPGLSPLADESHMAEEVKTRQPVLVIMGNPPYSGASSNKGAWISALINDYKQVDGKPLGEKNPKWLQDDYVKFIRFAQWKIDQAGEGVLGFITNHSYLDNPTFRGMRQSLMTSFDQLHVLNLHGNSLKKEKSPDGSKDENVFDIQQGVAILLAVKKKGLQKGVWRADLQGTRDSKYKALEESQLAQTRWQELAPRSEDYLFVPQDTTLAKEYGQWPRVTEILPVNVLGFQTHRDDFAIAFDQAQIERRLEDMLNGSLSDEELRERYGLEDTDGWTVSKARQRLRQFGSKWRSLVQPCAYRPFDIRWCCYDTVAMDRPRRELKEHVVGRQNLCLVSIRQMQDNVPYTHVSVVSLAAIDRVFACSRGAATIFPLYCYDRGNPTGTDVFEHLSEHPLGRHVNLNADVVARVANDLCLKMIPDGRGDLAHGLMGPEDLFAYIYAVLYSPTYRARYAEFLKTDFPRIPFTKDRDTFLKLAGLGQQLIDLHLMRSPELDNPISRFCGKGDSAVIKVEYDTNRGRVGINPTQYFDGITPDLWSYQIGGYQVLAKWLKDRKGRFLTVADTQHYSRIVASLAHTCSLQNAIDAVVVRVLLGETPHVD